MKEGQKKKLKVGGVIASFIGILMMLGDSGATGFIISFFGVILIFAGYAKTKEPIGTSEQTIEKKSAPADKELTQWNQEVNGKHILGIVAVVVAIMFFMGGDDSSVPQQPEQQHYSQVCAQAQVHVKELLKSPATADFPTCNEGRIIREPDNRFIVTSYVDSQNSFGAMIRTPWQVYLKYTPDDRVIFEDVRFDGKSIYDTSTTE